MNRLSDALPRVEAKLRELPADQVATLEATTTLDGIGEKSDYQQLQAESHAAGVLSLDEATFIYAALNNWDRCSLAKRVVVMTTLGQLAKAKLAARTQNGHEGRSP